MRKILLLVFVASALGFSGCKKCCEIKVDGNTVKVCDKDQIKAINNGGYTDVNGNPVSGPCH
jgi:hypothetical protein